MCAEGSAMIRGKSRMREIRSYGSARGVPGNRHPYRDPSSQRRGRGVRVPGCDRPCARSRSGILAWTAGGAPQLTAKRSPFPSSAFSSKLGLYVVHQRLGLRLYSVHLAQQVRQRGPIQDIGHGIAHLPHDDSGPAALDVAAFGARLVGHFAGAW